MTPEDWILVLEATLLVLCAAVAVALAVLAIIALR